MCEIFAMSAQGQRCINDELKEFYSHSPYHPNGWGLATSINGVCNWEKEPVCANESKYLKERLSEPISCEVALAHIRYATIGAVSWVNAHPFAAMDKSGRLWTLIHNGTIFDYPPAEHFTKSQNGETDSERILLYIIERINREIEHSKGELLGLKRFEIIEEIITDMSANNKLNIILFDEELLYCHTNCAGTLYRREEDDMSMISTRPLSVGRWESVPQLRVLAYKNGSLYKEGEKRSTEYVEDRKEIEQLYLAYSGL